MDRQEIIILFIVAILAVIGLVLMYNQTTTGDMTYPQLQQSNVISCNVDSDCYWALNSLQYECRANLCRPLGAIGPPQYEPRLKIR